jgi:hypothetical protein
VAQYCTFWDLSLHVKILSWVMWKHLWCDFEDGYRQSKHSMIDSHISKIWWVSTCKVHQYREFCLKWYQINCCLIVELLSLKRSGTVSIRQLVEEIEDGFYKITVKNIIFFNGHRYIITVSAPVGLLTNHLTGLEIYILAIHRPNYIHLWVKATELIALLEGHH